LEGEKANSVPSGRKRDYTAVYLGARPRIQPRKGFRKRSENRRLKLKKVAHH